MAYIIRYVCDTEWSGPYPDKAGEFCGNDPNPARVLGENVRIGRPANCASGTSEEMAARGFVGLYLVADSTGYKGKDARDVDTDILQEEVVTGERSPLRPFVPDVPMKKH